MYLDLVNRLKVGGVFVGLFIAAAVISQYLEIGKVPSEGGVESIVSLFKNVGFWISAAAVFGGAAWKIRL